MQSELKAVQERLADMGVRDVKVTFDAGIKRYPISDTKSNLAAVLKSYCAALKTSTGEGND